MEQETEAVVREVVTNLTVGENHPMQALSDKVLTPPKNGDIVEGVVIALVRGRLYVDLAPFGTGLIYGREYLNAADVLRKTNPGDAISAKVVDASGKDGYIELSLKEARQAFIWSEAEQAIAGGTVYTVEVLEANKGGLLMTWQGIKGFLPASQLTKEHYPRVPEGDKERVLSELEKFVGKSLQVRIITADPKEGKLIFSERTNEEGGGGTDSPVSVSEKYHVGDELTGVVTGAVDFGVFVRIDSNLEGLVHISELDWGLVEDPRTFLKVGEEVRVKVIEVKDGKVSLSIKALRENPWKSASERYKKGMEVSGVIIKYNKHGALASIEEGVAGLVHMSEFKDQADLKETLQLGKSYPFSIKVFEPKDQRMTLSYAKAPAK
jgi:small subunit ribosomal protein S1